MRKNKDWMYKLFLFQFFFGPDIILQKSSSNLIPPRMYKIKSLCLGKLTWCAILNINPKLVLPENKKCVMKMSYFKRKYIEFYYKT